MHISGSAAHSPNSPLALFQSEHPSLRHDAAMAFLDRGLCHAYRHTARASLSTQVA